MSYSISANTKRLYVTAFNTLKTFRRVYNLQEPWPPHANELVEFVSYLTYKQFSPNTIKSYISGISYYCKLYNLQDTTQTFLLRKVLMGLGRWNNRTDNRKPITLEILHNIIQLLPTICKSMYESALFSAIFTTAFYGYFRMGELVQNSCHDPGHAIQIEDVTYNTHTNAIHIFLKHSKTDQVGKGATVIISPTRQSLCPVITIRAYMQMRHRSPGTFFCHLSGKPATRYQVSAIFNMVIEKIGLDKQTYKFHSFRIGAATSDWAMGVNEHDIAIKGRWKSRCLYRYIRN